MVCQSILQKNYRAYAPGKVVDESTTSVYNSRIPENSTAYRGGMYVTERFEAFVTGISVCYKYIQRIKSAEMTELGLRGTHVMCLFFLSRHPEPLTAAQLSRLCAEDRAAVSRTVAELHRRGYIDIEAPRYRAQLRLTPEGQELALRLDGLIRRWVGFGGEGLTEEERSVFYRVLSRIADNLHKNMESAPDVENERTEYGG